MNFGKKLTILGDSIMRGVILDEVRGTYRRLTGSCADRMVEPQGLQVLNKSRFGWTIDRGLIQLEKSLKDGLSCDAVLLEYGGNDCDFDWEAVAAAPNDDHQPLTPLARFISTLKEMTGKVKDAGAAPVLMSLPPLDGERYFNFLVARGIDRQGLMTFLGDVQAIYRHHEAYSLAITGLAVETGSLYVPIREAFLASRRMPELICSDGIHPNAKGHALMSDVMADFIRVNAA